MLPNSPHNPLQMHTYVKVCTEINISKSQTYINITQDYN